MLGRAAPTEHWHGRDRLGGAAQTRAAPRSSFGFFCDTRQGVLYLAPEPQVTRDAWGSFLAPTVAAAPGDERPGVALLTPS